MNKKILIKKALAVAVILLFLTMSVIPSTGTTDVKQITTPATSGDTLYVGGSGPGNYTKIQDAINDSLDSDTVYVYDDSSPYYENVVVDKSINLIGENKLTTVIDGNKSEDVIQTTADNVRISRFTVQNSGINWYDAGIKFIYCNNCTIGSCIITKNNAGLDLKGSKNNTIINCSVVNNIYGILFSDESNELNKILNCTIQGNSNIGIVFEHILRYHQLNVIHGNIISNNQIGISMITSKSNEITNNLICNNSFCGIEIRICLIGCDNQMVHHNNFINNSQHAYDEGLNKWFEFDFFKSKGNYWDDWVGLRYKWSRFFPFLLPYRIAGSRFKFDWFPAYEPYDIEV